MLSKVIFSGWDELQYRGWYLSEVEHGLRASFYKLMEVEALGMSIRKISW